MVKFTFLVSGLLDKPVKITIKASSKLEAFAKIKDLYPYCTKYKLIDP